MDLGGFHMGLWTYKAITTLKVMLDLAMGCNPEIMGKIFLVKTPAVFTFIWRIIKGWLDERLR